MDFDNEIVFRIPAPSDGIETVLVLLGIAAILVGVLAVLHHRETMARGFGWLKEHPWEKASAPVNLLSWVTLICVGPVAAVLFVMAVGEAYALLQQTGGSESSAGSLGRGAVIVALIGAPFVIWRSVVAQKTVNVTEQGHITDRINTAVQGLGAEKTVKRLRKRTREPAKVTYVESDDDEFKYSQPNMEEVTEPNLEVRIGAIYALERIAQDSDRDHVQIMEILCAYIRQNAPAPAEDDWPELEMKEGEEDGPLEADWEQRLGTFREEQESATAALRVREDIQVALTVIGRRDPEQRKIEAGPGRGVKSVLRFDVPCPEYDGPEKGHDPEALHTYLRVLLLLKEILFPYPGYPGYRLDLRGADLRGADLANLELKGAKLTGTYLQGSNLLWARLQGAYLTHARLQGAVLAHARLQGANLEEAWLQGAEFSEARLQGARLWKARLHGAFLIEARLQGANFEGAQLQGANFEEAQLQGADLAHARLQGTDLVAARLQGAKLELAWMDNKTQLAGATLRGAAARFVDYTDVPHIAAHLDDMFGDATVTLPGGHGPEHESWPPHWPKFDLGPDFDDEWRKWQADPENYPVPDSP